MPQLILLRGFSTEPGVKLRCALSTCLKAQTQLEPFVEYVLKTEAYQERKRRHDASPFQGFQFPWGYT